MRHDGPHSPIWVVRQTGDASAYRKYLYQPDHIRKQFFTYCLQGVKNEDVDAEIWRKFFRVMIDYSRDDLAKLLKGDTGMLWKCFKWDWYKKCQREAQRRKARRQ